jgi:iron complex transport system substrate-binding protein
VTLKAAPSRIVSLSPTATQILFAIGAGKQVVAADDDSTLPANAPRTSLSGYDPNVEAIAHYQPQLVIISYNPNGLAASLAKLGIPVLDQDAASSLHGTYGQIGELGSVTGHGSTAQNLIAKMRSQIAAIIAKTPHFSPPLSYYYELDQTYYTVTSNTFVGSLMAMLGLHNIADAAPGAASGYPQLSDEFIVKADPKVIILADTVCCGQSAKTVAKRPGWQSIAAVRAGGVVGVNDSVASQWGPNVVTLERDVESALSRLTTRDHADVRSVVG